MFAVIKTGGKQYRVSKGDKFSVERLNASEGDSVQFNTVLMIGNGDTINVGSPNIEGAGVQATVVAQGRDDKVISFKKRRRKHSSARKKGHRQYLTFIEITDILESGAKDSGVSPALGSGRETRAAAQ
jgi:large subunit ribosomal protein L21